MEVLRNSPGTAGGTLAERDKKCRHEDVKCLSCGLEGTIEELLSHYHTRPDVLRAVLFDERGVLQWMIGTRTEIADWHGTWGDLKNLSVTVTDKQGKEIGKKARGDVGFTWEVEET